MKNKKNKTVLAFFLLYVFLLSSFSVQAQEKNNTENSYEQALILREKQKETLRFFTFSYENDLIGSGKDSNYTSGLRFTYMDTGAEVPALIKEIAEWIPTFSVNPTTSIYYSLGQNLYTPEDIKKTTLTNVDRPYAGWLYLSAGLTSVYKNHLDEIELSLGVVGSAALGEQTQKFVHKKIGSPDPKGWNNQLKNEPGVVLSWQRSWYNYRPLEIDSFSFRTSPHIGATLGNVYTYSNAGLSFGFMPSSQALQANPLRIRPAIPGNGYYDIPEDGFGWYLFSGIEGRALARNIFLDGNSFQHSHRVDKKYFIGDANIGIALTFNKSRLAYTLNYRTKEYEGQKDPEIFGSLSLSHRF